MHPQQNYLRSTVMGTALVLMALMYLFMIPEFDLGPFHFKRIAILADIMHKDNKNLEVPKDTVKAIKPVYADTCKTGITCIEDYSKDTSGMKPFLAALDSSKKQVVRIAFFGDSYIEGDIMLDPLRDSLQAIFGGSGVGFVPITSEVAGFRQTVIHSYDNWKTYSIVGDRSNDHPLGFAGHSFFPQKDNRVSFKTVGRNRLNEFPTARLYYGNTEGAEIMVNDEPVNLKASRRLQQVNLGGPITSLKLSVQPGNTMDLYGVEFESKTGIAVDNFSMRGNSGTGLSYVKEEMYRYFYSLNHYDLVVLAYGLNVANEKAKSYTWYIKGMNQTIAMIKRAFPRSTIIMVGCSDRGAKVDGEYQTMPGIKELIEAQRQMAVDNGVCFWDLFEAMGGDGTMVEWADMGKHAFANKDYTHLTFYGGKKVAEIFIGTLLYEKEKYDRKKKY
ncbi:MAG: hypothetical protein JWO06_727 [Bacteroidota bacterium]|nr:hypothetical protein [Bacteroidota bacterium]